MSTALIVGLTIAGVFIMLAIAGHFGYVEINPGVRLRERMPDGLGASGSGSLPVPDALPEVPAIVGFRVPGIRPGAFRP